MAGDVPQDIYAYLDSVFDDTIPLVFEKGYEHITCGGPAERASTCNESYCIRCARTVPHNEVGRLLDKILDKLPNSEYDS